MSDDYTERDPIYTRKATPEEIRASNRDPVAWFVIGALVATFLMWALNYID